MKAVILDDWERNFLHSPSLAKLKQYFDVEIYHDMPDEEELIKRISQADVIMAVRERTKFTKEILQQMKSIKLIAQTGAGLAHIDMKEATRLNIPVATTPGGTQGVVELIFGFMIAYSRNMLVLNEAIKGGHWPQSVGFNLEGKTIGIIGLGKIGLGTAKVAKAFNMNVLAWGPTLTPERAEEHGVTYTSLESLLKESNFVSVSVRLVPETRHLLNESHFKMMRKDAFFINTARGEVADEQALVKALKENQIGGAGLDVFAHEPLDPDHPLLTLSNVILTPHIGWKTDRVFENFLDVSIDNIISFFMSNSPKRIANPEVLGQSHGRN